MSAAEARHGQMAVAVGQELPITNVLYHRDAEPLESDSGFSVLFADAPHADELADDDERLRTICLHCLVDGWPEVGKGLDLAREHGEAVWYDEAEDWVLPE